MPKPRKLLRLTFTPPKQRGWWAYSHASGAFEAVYLLEEDLEHARERHALAEAVEIMPADVWSTRRLKKRERGTEPKSREAR